MEQDWKLVYTVDESYKSEIVQELLKENNIIGVVMNKKDTTYNSFGEFEIYVTNIDAEEARKLLLESKI